VVRVGASTVLRTCRWCALGRACLLYGQGTAGKARGVGWVGLRQAGSSLCCIFFWNYWRDHESVPSISWPGRVNVYTKVV
jgi:hypothetical protein